MSKPIQAPSRTSRWLAGLAAAGVFATALVAAALPASAAPNQYAPSIGTATGTVSVTPTNVPVAIKSDQLCPAGSGVVNGFLNSTDAGIVDGVVISANSTDLATLNTSGMPLDNNLVGLAQSAGRVLINGRYELSVVCYPDAFSVPTAQFDAVFNVTGGVGTGAGTTATWDVPGSAATTTAISASPAGSAAVGAVVTLTATMTPANAVGTVQFQDTAGGAPVDLGTPVAVAGGAATISTSTLAQGAHSLVARFSPATAAFLGSQSAGLSYVILGANQQVSTTTLTVDPAGPVAQGAPVTLTATVTPPQAVGSVTFTDGTVVIGQANVVGGLASVVTTTLEVGVRSLAAGFTPTVAADFAESLSATVGLLVLAPGGGGSGQFLDLLEVQGAGGAANDATGIRFAAPRACPGGDVVQATVKGPGSWQIGLAVPAGQVEGAFNAADDVVTVRNLDTLGLTIEPGRYNFVLACAETTTDTTFGFFVGTIWFYDSLHWLSRDPVDVGIPTSTVLTVAPADRALVGQSVLLEATVDAPAAKGKVEFRGELNQTTTVIGSAPLANGRARLPTTTLEFGLYYLTAVFIADPTNPPYNGSATDEVILAVTKGGPPVPLKAATVTGSPRVGSTLTCAAGFRGAATLGYLWLRDRTAIPAATTARYRLVAADAGKRLQCRAVATNAGGTVYRQSAAIRVGA